MNSFSAPYFQLLKAQLLANAGIIDIAPSDCKVIALQIHNATKQVVSETTIKRIFGFALSKFSPSQYTVDVLAKYCGYTGWKDFCEKQTFEKTGHCKLRLDWQNLSNEASRITEFTLQALRHRSGIPFNQTIERRFFDDHMESFIASDSMGTVIAAPASYGKSVALCHWVEKQMQLNYAKTTHDIILFFSSHALMSVLHSGKGLMDWMLALLGYSNDNCINSLQSLMQKEQYKFYLIIDGFDPIFLKKDEFGILLSQLEDIFAMSSLPNFIKLVLTMRTATWVNNRHEWENDKYSWFNTLSIDNDFINVPRLTPKEITALRDKINPADTSFLSIKVVQALSHPLYFQYFFKQYKAEVSFKHLDNISYYDILSAFITNKIYQCQYSAEKMAFINQFVEELDFNDEYYHVAKLKLGNLLKQYGCAYHDLLSLGVLREINNSSNTRYLNYVSFVDGHILDHFIARVLLAQSDGGFDPVAIHTINSLLKGSTHKLPILKWCVLDIIKGGRFTCLQYLPDVNMSIIQKAEMMSFITDLLKRETALADKQSPLLKIFRGEPGQVIFEYFLGMELISIDYKATLQTLLVFNLSDKQRIMVHTKLGIIAVIQLNMNDLERTIAYMAALPVNEYNAFPVDPHSCLDAIFHYFKFGFIKRDTMAELTKTSFTMSNCVDAYFKKCASNDILFLLGIYTLWLADNPKKVLRFINVIERIYHDDGKVSASNYNFFIMLLKADAHFKLNNKIAVKTLYDSVCRAYDKTEGRLTPFMKALFFSLKIKLFINKNTSNSILNELKSVNTVAEDTGNKFSRVYILTLLLKNEEFLSENPSFKKQAGYDYNMILTRSGIDRDRFQI
jgi:hypothetical protein